MQQIQIYLFNIYEGSKKKEEEKKKDIQTS